MFRNDHEQARRLQELIVLTRACEREKNRCRMPEIKQTRSTSLGMTDAEKVLVYVGNALTAYGNAVLLGISGFGMQAAYWAASAANWDWVGRELLAEITEQVKETT